LDQLEEVGRPKRPHPEGPVSAGGAQDRRQFATRATPRRWSNFVHEKNVGSCVGGATERSSNARIDKKDGKSVPLLMWGISPLVFDQMIAKRLRRTREARNIIIDSVDSVLLHAGFRGFHLFVLLRARFVLRFAHHFWVLDTLADWTNRHPCSRPISKNGPWRLDSTLEKQ